MNPLVMEEFGNVLYQQSIRPYKFQPYDDNEIDIVGLDSEFYTKNDLNYILSWQLGFTATDGQIYKPPFNAVSMLREVVKVKGYKPKYLFFITFFITAEAQFFFGDDWDVSEYKGKYSFSKAENGTKIVVLDLAAWFPSQKLAAVAPVFGLEKLDYPIKDKMDEVASGKLTPDKMFANKKFQKYAINDAVVTGEIWRRIRNSMLSRYDVDILNTKTAPATSAAIYKKRYITKALTQSWTKLRKQAVASAWGGRTECFYRGERKHAYAFDARQHHPSSAMAIGVMPLEKDWQESFSTEEFLEARGGLCKVMFEYPEDEMYPCLPVFSQGSLVFPLAGVSDCSQFECKLAAECGAKLTLIGSYIFNDGTTSFAEFLAELKADRDKSTDPAEREEIKLLSNGIVGKLFQKNLSPSLQVFRDYAVKEHLPLQIVMNMRGLDLPTKATVGSSFFPEWYALILGYARANISRVCRDNKALMVSSDTAVITHKNLVLNDKSIEYRLDKEGEYLAYRSKLYRLGEKVAHHAIHNRDAAVEVLANFMDQDDFEYRVTHIVKLRESLRGIGTFGVNLEKSMSISLGFDYKRKLVGNDGWSVPWKNIEEREAFLSELKEAEK